MKTKAGYLWVANMAVSPYQVSKSMSGVRFCCDCEKYDRCLGLKQLKAVWYDSEVFTASQTIKESNLFCAYQK